MYQPPDPVSVIRNSKIHLPTFEQSFLEWQEGGLKFQVEKFDFGHQIGICVTFPDKRRHAVRCQLFDENHQSIMSPETLALAIEECKEKLIEWVEKTYLKAA